MESFRENETSFPVEIIKIRSKILVIKLFHKRQLFQKFTIFVKKKDLGIKMSSSLITFII